ncbi:MAG: SHOCT domain-containing protein [Chloroflexi bacterium]|nr:SHOCT domain-containing protein [Chloroflexota bacterium]
MGGWSGNWGGTGGAGVIFMVLFWALLIGGAVLLVKSIADRGSAGQVRRQSDESALEILRRRYASGEITRDEFEQAKKDLN